ncbi:hypothetical protein EYF80_038839 [Liparis tanakae]|uniref:Uncharacterized protein n=1 Tax=Liparis tanakae TaxID=230148 RepID=A0A4Z2GBK2_9TELE|nr:hypothetical protein EYF80_038839 [Liparis tanakae]
MSLSARSSGGRSSANELRWAHLCSSSSRFLDVCVSFPAFLNGGCVSAAPGSSGAFCCSERRHAAMTTAVVSSHWSGYSPPRPRRCGCSSSKVDSRFLDFPERTEDAFS